MQTNNQTVFRSILSPAIAISFIGVSVSGIMMLMHFRAGGLHALHECMGIFMVVVGLLHLLVNWRMFTALFRFKIAIVATVTATALLCMSFLAGGGTTPGNRGGHGPGPGGPEHGGMGVHSGGRLAN